MIGGASGAGFAGGACSLAGGLEESSDCAERTVEISGRKNPRHIRGKDFLNLRTNKRSTSNFQFGELRTNTHTSNNHSSLHSAAVLPARSALPVAPRA